MQRTRSRGFTLIEIMIVVAIVGVLASIAIPNYQRFVCKARQTEAKGLLKGVYVAQSTYFNETNQYICTPADLVGVGSIEYQSTRYNILTIDCDAPPIPNWFHVTMESRFIGPGGSDIWRMDQGGILLHLQDGCNN